MGGICMSDEKSINADDLLDDENQDEDIVENELDPFMNGIVVDTDIDEGGPSRKINAIELTDKIGETLQKAIEKVAYPAIFSGAQQAVANMSSILNGYAYDPTRQMLLSAAQLPGQSAIEAAQNALNAVSLAAIGQIPQAAQAEIMSSALYELGDVINSMPTIDYSHMLDPLQDVMDYISGTYLDAFHSVNLGCLLLDQMNSIVDIPFQCMDIHDDREKYSESYLKTLVECYWFPYISSALTLGYINRILDIRLHTRSANSRKKQIDSFIFSVFNTRALRAIKSHWYHTVEDKPRNRILRQCIDAHIDDKYPVFEVCHSFCVNFTAEFCGCNAVEFTIKFFKVPNN